MHVSVFSFQPSTIAGSTILTVMERLALDILSDGNTGITASDIGRLRLSLINMYGLAVNSHGGLVFPASFRIKLGG